MASWFLSGGRQALFPVVRVDAVQAPAPGLDPGGSNFAVRGRLHRFRIAVDDWRRTDGPGPAEELVCSLVGVDRIGAAVAPHGAQGWHGDILPDSWPAGARVSRAAAAPFR